MIRRLGANFEPPLYYAKSGADGSSRGLDGPQTERQSGSPRDVDRADFPAQKRSHWWDDEGDFFPASEAAMEALRFRLITQKTGVARHTIPDSQIDFFTEKDLATNLAQTSPKHHRSMLARGQANQHRVVHITSSAGDGTRGGGYPRMLIPLNMTELIPGREQQDELRRQNDIYRSPGSYATIFNSTVAGRTPDVPSPRTHDSFAQELRNQAEAKIAATLEGVETDPRVLTSMVAMFITDSLASMKGGDFPFFIWTSRKQHRRLLNSFRAFQNDFDRREYTPDTKLQRVIVEALERRFEYIAKSKYKTPFFAYQEEFRGYHPENHDPPFEVHRGGAGNSEGAGALVRFMHESGLSADLYGEGRDIVLWNNGEVHNDVQKILGAHLETNFPVSVVVVPEQEGYSGGWPFIAKFRGGRRLVMIEQELLTDSFKARMVDQRKSGGNFFNTNTLCFPTTEGPLHEAGDEVVSEALTGIGFEFRNDLWVPKLNMQAIAAKRRTAAIGGRVPDEYEHLKSLSDFLDRGEHVVLALRHRWERDAREIRLMSRRR
ncbi:MAG: hypothetical protein ACKVPX_01255 [Myxococcaceae bacterium]